LREFGLALGGSDVSLALDGLDGNLALGGLDGNLALGGLDDTIENGNWLILIIQFKKLKNNSKTKKKLKNDSLNRIVSIFP